MWFPSIVFVSFLHDQFDIDEYLIPMGQTRSIHELLDKLDEEGMKIVSFRSWRAWPRRRLLE
jgi:hypothetical protein